MKVRFGVGLGADTGPDELAAIVDHLEATGVDSLWFSELVYSKAVDPFIGMAHALARTTQSESRHVGRGASGPPPGAGGEATGVAGGSRSQTGTAGVRPAVGDSGRARHLRRTRRGACRRLRRVVAAAEIRSGARRCLVRRRLLLREFGRRRPAPRQATGSSGSEGRRPPGSAGSAGWATAGWAASSPRPKPAAAASRSSRRRTRPAARSKRTISASISPSATANCRTDWPLRYGAVGPTSIPAS